MISCPQSSSRTLPLRSPILEHRSSYKKFHTMDVHTKMEVMPDNFCMTSQKWGYWISPPDNTDSNIKMFD